MSDASAGLRADVKLSLLLEAVARGRAQTMVARGSSMWPALRDGDVVELSPCTTVNLGSVVALRSQSGGFLIHRVCGVRSDGALLLKGDHNRSPDGWFPREQVVATVERVNRGTGFETVWDASRGLSRWARIEARLQRKVQRMRRWGTMGGTGGLPPRDIRGSSPEASV